ncbi:MAG TPA: SDR family oxidoreductase [Acidimicrobiia bacterium]|nr:SDR family oxidoreductase [Acidimicrobiia bacterium]
MTNPGMPLEGTVAIVTGAGSGIGRAVARNLADAGAAVALAARSLDRLETAAEDIRTRGGQAIAVRCDVTSESQVLAMFDEVEAEMGPVDVLVNNAATLSSAAIEDTTLADWQHVLDVNLTGAFLCMREAIRRMKPRSRGRILNIGSISASVPRPMTASYAASKAGLVGLSRTAAIEARRHGIAVGCLHPGNVRTETRQDMSDPINRENMMSVDEVAELARAMLLVSQTTVVWELTALPIEQAFLGRG